MPSCDVFLDALGDVQIPLLATILLTGSLAKVARVVRFRSLVPAFGPPALVPIRLRRWTSAGLCLLELAFGAGLVLTATGPWYDDAAVSLRVGTGLVFLVATLALLELRSTRQDLGFGEVSATPVTTRALIRSALLAAAAIGTIGINGIDMRWALAHPALPAGLGGAELVVFALLSPEIPYFLVRLGYSAPCELRQVGAEQTLAALGRSAQWRRHSHLIAPGDEPADIWRELCWRYIAYPSNYPDAEAQVVFAVHLQHRRPAVLSALVDTATGEALPWPSTAGQRAKSWRPRRAYRRAPGNALAPRNAGSPASSPARSPAQ
jgi:hypothetical protein